METQENNDGNWKTNKTKQNKLFTATTTTLFSKFHCSFFIIFLFFLGGLASDWVPKCSVSSQGSSKQGQKRFKRNVGGASHAGLWIGRVAVVGRIVGNDVVAEEAHLARDVEHVRLHRLAVAPKRAPVEPRAVFVWHGAVGGDFVRAAQRRACIVGHCAIRLAIHPERVCLDIVQNNKTNGRNGNKNRRKKTQKNKIK